MSKGIQNPSTNLHLEKSCGIAIDKDVPALYTKELTKAMQFHRKEGQKEAFGKEYPCHVSASTGT